MYRPCMNIRVSGPYGYVPQKLPIKSAPDPEQSYYKQVLVGGGMLCSD